MDYKHTLEIASYWAAIFTAVVAAGASTFYFLSLARKKKKLEDYLRTDGRAHTIVHLVARLGMTEDEVIQGSFRSRHIERRIHKDEETGLADQILLRYSEKSVSG